jgi:hypothetical protein
MLRICLIIALVTGIAVVALNFVFVADKITTIRTQREEEKTQKETAQRDLGVAKKDLQATRTKLTETETTLASTKRERDTAVAKADSEIKRASDLAEKLTKTTQERDDAQANLAAFTASGFNPEQVANLGKQLKGLQDEVEVLNTEKKILAREKTRLFNELALLRDPVFHVPLPPELKGKVLVADPKWDFVVLNVGADQGVAEQGELLVSRDGKLVAKLRIETVEKGRSIANVMPGWKLGDVMEGDQVFPAYIPAS